MVFPQFNTKDDHGHLQQQDANECWVELVRMFQQTLPGVSTTDGEVPEGAVAAGGAAAAGRKLVTEYFGGQMSVKMKCTESEEEPSMETTEDFLQLGCYLSQGIL